MAKHKLPSEEQMKERAIALGQNDDTISKAWVYFDGIWMDFYSFWDEPQTPPDNAILVYSQT